MDAVRQRHAIEATAQARMRLVMTLQPLRSTPSL
jgi:hypothetical protein